MPGPGGVDLYVGGVEHAVLHLLYARFWHKVLYDLGHLSSFEPFRKLFNQGYIQAYAYHRRPGHVRAGRRRSSSATARFFYDDEEVTREYGKMGKSLKNVVTPDEMCETYGADTFRVYEMSMGPLDVSRPWETRAVVGSQRFLQRVWRLVVDEQTGADRGGRRPTGRETRRLLHRVIAGVREDMDELRFNTAMAKLIELTNRATAVTSGGVAPREVVEPLVLMVAPFAPHLAEELWRRLGHRGSLAYVDFPVADPALLVAGPVTYPVQVNGKVRGRIEVAADATEDAVRAAALDEVAAAAGRPGATQGHRRPRPDGQRRRLSTPPPRGRNGHGAEAPDFRGPRRSINQSGVIGRCWTWRPGARRAAAPARCRRRGLASLRWPSAAAGRRGRGCGPGPGRGSRCRARCPPGALGRAVVADAGGDPGQG